MRKAPIPARELERLAALRASAILDSDPEAAFDDLTQIASLVCETPISLVTFIDADRQWIKSRVGADLVETTRDAAFCARALDIPHPVREVPDATRDARFADNEYVTGDPALRFYAGATIRSADGHGMGTVCVIDTKPRQLTDTQREVLAALARQASTLLAQRQVAQQLFAALEEVRQLNELLPICTFCHRVRDDSDYWADLNAYLRDHAGSQLSHAICPDCLTDRFGELLGEGTMT